MNQIPVFVINLARSVRRKEFMHKQLTELGIEHEFIDAVDGNADPENFIKELYPPDKYETHTDLNDCAPSKNELGCLLSHLKVYKHIIDNEIEYACILEDDAEVKGEIRELLDMNQIDRINWELILLGHASKTHWSLDSGGEATFLGKKFKNEYRLKKPVEHPYFSHAYLLRRSGAIKLINYAYPIRMTADFLTGSAPAAEVRLHLLSPPCFVQKDAFVNESTIKERSGCVEEQLWPSGDTSLFKRFKGYLKKHSFLRAMKKSFNRFLMLLRKLGLGDCSYVKKI